MDKARNRSRENRKRIEAIDRRMSSLSKRVSTVANDIRELRRSVCEIRELWEDTYLLNRPVTSPAAKATLARRFPIYDKQEICVWERIAIKWRDASELRGLMRAAPGNCS
jgi:hypothetical protein